jgi:hypothetical protein
LQPSPPPPPRTAPPPDSKELEEGSKKSYDHVKVGWDKGFLYQLALVLKSRRLTYC